MPQYATELGTSAYMRRFADQLASGHFRRGLGMWLSSIGLGTYLGDADTRTDDAYRAAIGAALAGGCNVIDTAINYRFQRSERVIGEALAAAVAAGAVQREEVVIATKGGYIPFDSAPPRDPSRWFYDTFIATGVTTIDAVTAGCHCMTPAYLRHQLATSLHNLQVDCVDIYYVHNPETQLAELPREAFMTRVGAAFAQLEEAAATGKLRAYGIATWNGLRQPEGARDHLSLQALVRLAEEVGGRDHHFRVIQAPFNLAMPEALIRATQSVDGEAVSLLAAAERLGITVVSSAALLQGQLSRRLPPGLSEAFPDLRTNAQRAIQFARSAPGLTTALVGMKQLAHAQENLATARVAPASTAQFRRLFAEAPPNA